MFLIYKISGGLNHMLIQINNAVILSKITGRTLIIDCNSGAFKSDFSDYFNIPNIKYYTNYDILSSISEFSQKIDELKNSNMQYLDGNYYLQSSLVSLNSNKIIKSSEKILIFTALTDSINVKNEWFIKVNKNIVEKISKKTISRTYLGVHFRNTDMKHDLKKIEKKILAHSKKYDTLYFSTDDCFALNNLSQEIKNKFTIIQYTKPINNLGKNIHYGNPNKKEMIINTLIDMYYLVKADHFIESEKSSMSRRIIQLRRKDNFFE